MQWVYPTATVTASHEEGIACWAVSGIITPQLLPSMVVDAFAWHEETQAKAHVSDFRGAVVGVTLDAFRSYADVLVKPPHWIANPMAIVPGEHEDFFRAYAVAAAERGIGRVVFNDFERARAWASRIALLMPSGGSGPSPHCTKSKPSSAPPRGTRPATPRVRPPTGLKSV